MSITQYISLKYERAKPTAVRAQKFFSSGWSIDAHDGKTVLCSDPSSGEQEKLRSLPLESFNLQNFLKEHPPEQLINIDVRSELDTKVLCDAYFSPCEVTVFLAAPPVYLNERYYVVDLNRYFRTLLRFCLIERPCAVVCSST